MVKEVRHDRVAWASEPPHTHVVRARGWLQFMDVGQRRQLRIHPIVVHIDGAPRVPWPFLVAVPHPPAPVASANLCAVLLSLGYHGPY
jgi:hypothetical protein